MWRRLSSSDLLDVQDDLERIIRKHPELQAILEDEEYEGLFYERVKQGYRAWRERQTRERERLARMARRRERIRRLTFGLFPR